MPSGAVTIARTAVMRSGVAVNPWRFVHVDTSSRLRIVDRPEVARVEAEQLARTRDVKGRSASGEWRAARHVWQERVEQLLGRIRGKRRGRRDGHNMTAGTTRGEGSEANCGSVAVIEVTPQVSGARRGIGGELLRPSRQPVVGVAQEGKADRDHAEAVPPPHHGRGQFVDLLGERIGIFYLKWELLVDREICRHPLCWRERHPGRRMAAGDDRPPDARTGSLLEHREGRGRVADEDFLGGAPDRRRNRS